MIVTFKYRIKDATTGKHLAAHARAVNLVWNFCVQTQKHAYRWSKKWPTAFDLINLTAGSSKELGVHSDTIGQTCIQFAESRNQHRKCPRWRNHRKALAWIPFRTRFLSIECDAITYLGRRFRFWAHRPLEGKPKTGAFVQDARGRWFVTIQCEVEERKDCGNGIVGIDLGLKDLAVLSDGTRIENQRHYAKHEAALAVAQRAGNKRRTRAIHAKIANARKHHLHVQSHRLVMENRLIAVGNVNAAVLKQAGMGKSISDASWSAFRTMLRYKARRHGATYIDADERFTTRTCSACGSRSGPKGRKDLGIRQWCCPDCGTIHDRDHNAALNILAGAECRPLAEEIPVV